MRIKINNPEDRKPKFSAIAARFHENGVPNLYPERVVVNTRELDGAIQFSNDPNIPASERESMVLDVVDVFHKLIDHFSRDKSVLSHLFYRKYGERMYSNDDTGAFRWAFKMLNVMLEQMPCHQKQTAKALDAVRTAVKRIEDLRATADKALRMPAYTYGNGLVAVAYDSCLLLLSPAYLLGKHGADTSSAGSKLGQIDSADKLTGFVQDRVDEATLLDCKGGVKLPNMNSGYVVGTDTLATIVSLTKDGKKVQPGFALEQGVAYTAVVRDADGNDHQAIVRYEVTRPASSDGKFPAITQPVAYVDADPPSTQKLNIIIRKVNLKDERAAWLEPQALKGLGDAIKGRNKTYLVVSVFPGGYAPPANEPVSSQSDPHVGGMTGNNFWRIHALMRKPKDCNAMDLAEVSGAVKVFKKPVVLAFEYAKEDTTIETKEGPVKCAKGDAILTGTQGERWPIPRQKFESTYDVVGEGQCSKKKIEVLALQMDAPFTVNVSWNKDPLAGKSGDWLVQYGKGDHGIVSQGIFAETYARVV